MFKSLANSSHTDETIDPQAIKDFKEVILQLHFTKQKIYIIRIETVLIFTIKSLSR